VDAIGFFLARYGEVHQGLVDSLFDSLSEARLRARPHPGVNTVAWLLWHSARIEDVALNRFLTDRPQALEEWFERLAVPRRDVGTGMSDAEVDELSARIDLHALRGYWGAVTARTLAAVETFRGSDLEAPCRANASGVSSSPRVWSPPARSGSRSFGREAGAAPGSSPRPLSSTPTATTSRRASRPASGAPGVLELQARLAVCAPRPACERLAARRPDQASPE